MRDIKPKEEEIMNGPTIDKGPSKDKSKKIYPTLRLQHEFFPETKKWEVGKEYTVELKLRMTGLSISRFENDSDFDIIGFGVDGKLKDKKED